MICSTFDMLGGACLPQGGKLAVDLQSKLR